MSVVKPTPPGAFISRGQDGFDLIEMAPNVHFAFARNAYMTNCNSLVVEGRDSVAVIDTQATPRAASVLRDAVAERIGKRVSHVINTHHHWDHWQGNAAYVNSPPAPSFIASTAARSAMETAGLAEIKFQLRPESMILPCSITWWIYALMPSIALGCQPTGPT